MCKEVLYNIYYMYEFLIHTHTEAAHSTLIPYQYHQQPFHSTSITEHYFVSMHINHPRAVTHSSNISIMVHHLRLREMKVIHSKMDHSCPACHMQFSVRRQLYCRFLGHLSSVCIFEVQQSSRIPQIRNL